MINNKTGGCKKFLAKGIAVLMVGSMPSYAKATLGTEWGIALGAVGGCLVGLGCCLQRGCTNTFTIGDFSQKSSIGSRSRSSSLAEREPLKVKEQKNSVVRQPKADDTMSLHSIRGGAVTPKGSSVRYQKTDETSFYY